MSFQFKMSKALTSNTFGEEGGEEVVVITNYLLNNTKCLVHYFIKHDRHIGLTCLSLVAK